MRRSSAGEKRVVIRRVRSRAGLSLSASTAFGCWIVLARTWRKGGRLGVRDFNFAAEAGAAFFTTGRCAGDAGNALIGEPMRPDCTVGLVGGLAVTAGGDAFAGFTGGFGFGDDAEAIAAGAGLRAFA